MAITAQEKFLFSIETKIDILYYTGKSIYEWIKFIRKESDNDSKISMIFFNGSQIQGFQHSCTKQGCNCVGSWETGNLAHTDFGIYINWENIITCWTNEED
jgi:hypothetical protein